MRHALPFLVACVAACSSTTIRGGADGGARDGGIAQGPQDDDADGAISAPGDGGAPGTTPDLAQPLDGYGTVYVYLTRAVTSSVAYSSTSVGATFFETVPPAGTTATCTTSKLDGCDVTSCTGTSSAGPTPPEAAAGTITISGGGESYTLHNPAGSHETVSTAALSWSGGETLGISSTGATVGAFSDSLVVPEQIVMTSPYLPQLGAVAITRSIALGLDWTGGVHGQGVFVLGASSGSASTSAICRFPASLQHATISAAVLSKFPVGVASFSASTVEQHVQRVGAWQVTTQAYFNAVYDTGRTVTGQLQLD